MKLPLFNSSAMVLLVVAFVWANQIVDSVAWFEMTRLPSPMIVSIDEAGSMIGFSRLATHTGVSLGTLLNHMPRYQLRVFWDDLLPVWKKPSANLPLLEMMVLFPASTSPDARVSIAAPHAERCGDKRIPRRIATRDMLNK